MRPKERIIEKLASIKLVNKLILLYIGLIALPVSCIGIYTVSRNMKEVAGEIVQNGMQKNKLTIRHIEQNADVCYRNMTTILSNNDLIDFISTYDNKSAIDLFDFQKNIINHDITRLASVNPDINRIRIYVKNPNLSESLDFIYHYDRIQGSSVEKETLKQNGGFYWVYGEKEKDLKTSEADSAKNTVSVYSIIKVYGRDKPVGILEINTETKNFFNEVYESSSNSSTVIYVPEERKLIMNPSVNSPELGEEDIETFQNELSSRTNGISGSFQLNILKKKYMVVYEKMDTLSLTVFEITRLDNVIAENRRNTWVVIMSVIGLLVILSWLTKIVTEIVLGKTQSIIYYMRRVKRGELDIKIPDFGMDEIGELGRHFKVMIERLNQLIQDNLRKETLAKDAQIGAMQSQINAHFIYNVLANIGMMAQLKNDYDVSDSVTTLGELLRYSMNWKSQTVALKDELQYIKNYISLLNIRFDYTINLSENIEKDMLDQVILKMMLQPIVENAVKHGIEPLGENTTIRLSVYKDMEYCRIEISDNGVGMKEEKLNEIVDKMKSALKNSQKEAHGIGLQNVYERIRMYFGEECTMELMSKENCYTKVSITIPIKVSKELIQ